MPKRRPQATTRKRSSALAICFCAGCRVTWGNLRDAMAQYGACDGGRGWGELALVGDGGGLGFHAGDLLIRQPVERADGLVDFGVEPIQPVAQRDFLLAAGEGGGFLRREFQSLLHGALDRLAP